MKKTVSVLALAGSLAFLGAGGAQANHNTADLSGPAGVVVAQGTDIHVAPQTGTGLGAGMLIWGGAGFGAVAFGAVAVSVAKRRSGATA